MINAIWIVMQSAQRCAFDTNMTATDRMSLIRSHGQDFVIRIGIDLEPAMGLADPAIRFLSRYVGHVGLIPLWVANFLERESVPDCIALGNSVYQNLLLR